LERLAGAAGSQTTAEVATPRRAFVTAFAATALNPLTIALWTAAFSAAAATTATRSLTTTAAVLIGVGLGTLCWYSSFTAAVSIARRRVGPRLLATVDVAAGSGIIGLGALLGYRSVHEH
jgi:putative LysE/RhtB family amino acid efflux pump